MELQDYTQLLSFLKKTVIVIKYNWNVEKKHVKGRIFEKNLK